MLSLIMLSLIITSTIYFLLAACTLCRRSFHENGKPTDRLIYQRNDTAAKESVAFLKDDVPYGVLRSSIIRSKLC